MWKSLGMLKIRDCFVVVFVVVCLRLGWKFVCWIGVWWKKGYGGGWGGGRSGL